MVHVLINLGMFSGIISSSYSSVPFLWPQIVAATILELLSLCNKSLRICSLCFSILSTLDQVKSTGSLVSEFPLYPVGLRYYVYHYHLIVLKVYISLILFHLLQEKL